jgi:DNA sulfur modification protein DndD
MVIKRIELENFRIYQGYHCIDLSPNQGKNVFIVSGKNGFGKTTFLMSLVWCLYGRQMGEVDEPYRKEINDQGGYSKYIVNSLNREARSGSANARQFSVSITLSDAIIPELTCDEITIKRTFSLLNAGEEEVQILIDGHENQLVKELTTDKMKGEEIFIRDFLLPIEVAKFFFFDAEKIVSLAEVNTEEQRKSLSKAYSEILGIKKYDDLRKEYEAISLRLRTQTAHKTIRDEVINCQAVVKRCEGDIDDYTTEVKRLKDQKEVLKHESDQIQIKLIRAGNSITQEELAELKNTETELVGRQDELYKSLQESFDIIPFALAGGKLIEVSAQLESENTFKTARYKQDEITEKTNRILTELMDAPKPKGVTVDYEIKIHYAETVKQLLKKHFFNDAPNVPDDFKTLHDFSATEQNEFVTLLTNLRQSFREAFKNTTRDYERTYLEIRQIRSRIRLAEANADDPIVQADRAHKQEIDRKIEEIDNELIRLSGKIDSCRADITVNERRLSELREKLTVAASLKEKDERVERIIQRLREFIAHFQARKKVSLEGQIRDGLNMLMHKKQFIDRVEVRIDYENIDIDLLNHRNDVIRKDSLSKGEQQMYATALLRGLVEESDIEFPVFIDSPMQKFDDEHALNIVKDFYPTISKQVILFPLINKELTQKEYQLLRPHVARTYLIHNVHADKSEFRPVEPAKLFEEYNALYN